MKKFIYSFLTIVLLMFSTVACKDEFLDRYPTNSVSEASVFLTVDNARAALNGIHRFLYFRMNPPSRQDGFGQGSLNLSMDFLGDDMVMSSTGNGWYVNTYRWIDHRTENFNLCDFPYRYYYRVIANANLIINNIDAATGEVPDRNEVKAQALTYRAHSYFQLVQLYGERYNAGGGNTQLGVPLVLESTIENFPRETVENVYTQINQDLNDAIALFATATPRINKSHLNVNVAQGIKARVAMAQGLWSQAITAAVAARTGYPLMSKANYTAGFNDYTIDEWIWGSHQIQDQQAFFASYFAYISHNFSSTFIRTNPQRINNILYDAVEAIDPTDIRLENFAKAGLGPDEKPTTGSLSVTYQNRKFTAADNGLSIGDVPHMRAAEMYLIEAEANWHLGQEGNAAQALLTLNQARCDNYTLSTNTGQALFDEIMLYRRIELWGEGFRFLDLKRLNLPLERVMEADGGLHNPTLTQPTGISIPAGDIRWQFLIPRSELNVNDQVVQNPQ